METSFRQRLGLRAVFGMHSSRDVCHIFSRFDNVFDPDGVGTVFRRTLFAFGIDDFIEGLVFAPFPVPGEKGLRTEGERSLRHHPSGDDDKQIETLLAFRNDEA